jgi:2',3'-cyclic-nucleotide 2'-phosphodiesterase / 3'-nucleotidase
MHTDPTSVEIQILHTSDLHGRFINYDYTLDRATESGSLAAVAKVIKDLRKKYEHTYLIDTGDTFQGNHNELFLSDIADNPMTLAMNALQYDSFTLGNHEFNFGLKYVYSIIDSLSIPTLAANVYNSDGTRLAKPYIILNKGGVRIAIVGMVTPNIVRWDSDHLEGAIVRMPLDEMRELWPQLEGRADLYLFANHLAWHDSHRQGDGYESLIAAYPQFKVILISHSHQRLAEVTEQYARVQPGVSGSHLGQILLRFVSTGSGYDLVEMQANLIAMVQQDDDPQLEDLTRDAHQLALTDIRIPVGKLVGGSLVPPCELMKLSAAQIGCTPLIALINDIQRYYSHADVSLTTLFHVAANLHEGEINRADILNMYKHNNRLRVYQMTGAQLKELMEHGVRYFKQWQTGDLTLSFDEHIPIYDYAMFGGVLYDINIAMPIGNRIESLCWPSGLAVAATDIIKVVMDDFRAKGFVEQDLFDNGADVQLLTPPSDDTCKEEDVLGIRHLIIKYIQSRENHAIRNNINSKENGFRLVGYHWDESLRAKAVEQLNRGLIKIPEGYNGLSFYTKAIRAEDLI